MTVMRRPADRRRRVLIEVHNERSRQEGLRREGAFAETCASRTMIPGIKMAVLTEEIGEVARALLEGDEEALREELVQVAAVAVAWAESLT